MNTVWLDLFSFCEQNSSTLRTTKGKQNELESILALYMPDPGLIPSIITSIKMSIKIIKAYQLKRGVGCTQRMGAENSLRKTPVANTIGKPQIPVN